MWSSQQDDSVSNTENLQAAKKDFQLNKTYEETILNKRSVEKPYAKFQEDRVQELLVKGEEQQ